MRKPNYKTAVSMMLISVVLLLSACTTLDPYTREEKTSNAVKGAAIGAAAGAAVGLITGDDSAERKKRALILAGVGAVAGGGVGAYMDQQEMELRQKLEGTGVSVTRDGDNITLNMPGNVTFAVDSSDISSSFYPVLDSVGLVLDEFDRMLDMGFIKDVNRILDGMKQRNHTMLFSATLDKSQQSMINNILTNHVTVKVNNGNSSADAIEQEVIKLKPGEDKFRVLQDMLTQNEFKKVLLFEETKHRVSRLCIKLNNAGFQADQIHGNKSQNARQNALKAFKQGRVQVLVATDVASRGLDVSDVSHVINYQVPQTHDSYIHRIGRTGRAGKVGKAYTFVA